MTKRPSCDSNGCGGLREITFRQDRTGLEQTYCRGHADVAIDSGQARRLGLSIVGIVSGLVTDLAACSRCGRFVGRNGTNAHNDFDTRARCA